MLCVGIHTLAVGRVISSSHGGPWELEITAAATLELAQLGGINEKTSRDIFDENSFYDILHRAAPYLPYENVNFHRTHHKSRHLAQ